jgi:hypothetical protein
LIVALPQAAFDGEAFGGGAALGKAMEWLGDADRKKNLWGSINHARGA